MNQDVKRTIKDYLEDRQKYLERIKQETSFTQKLKLRTPNILTRCRFIAPLIAVPLACSGFYIPALIVNGLAAITDAFDGFFARRWHAYSDYGRKLDPICDKMFSIGATLPMLNNPFLILPIIIGEIAIATISCKSLLKNNDPRSSILGKVKTGVLSIFLASMYLLKGFNIPLTVLAPFLTITSGFQLATAIQYYKIDKKKEKTKQEQENKQTLIKLETTLESSAKVIQKELEQPTRIDIEPTIEEQTKAKPKVKTLGTYPKRPE